MVFSPLDGIGTSRGGEGLRPSSTHCSAEPLFNSCISNMYVSVVAAVLSGEGVAHVILAVQGERGVAVMSSGDNGGPGGGEP